MKGFSAMRFENQEQLDESLSEPPPYLNDALAQVPGDILVLGVAGKMGPTLARMAVRSLASLGSKARVIGVARFSNPAERARLERWGIETIRGERPFHSSRHAAVFSGCEARSMPRVFIVQCQDNVGGFESANSSR